MESFDRATIMEYLEVKWPAFVRDALALPEAQRSAWLHGRGIHAQQTCLPMLPPGGASAWT